LRKGNQKVEQVDVNASIVMDLDTSWSSSEIFAIFSTCFDGIETAEFDSRVMVGYHEGNKYAIQCKNVTYLGTPHPAYKKRIQISRDLFKFVHEAFRIGAKPLLMGIYQYGENTIFVDFKLDTYITKRAHNSSAHIYTDDIAAATAHGYFQKEDCFGNTVTAFRPDAVTTFLDEQFGIDRTIDAMIGGADAMIGGADASIGGTGTSIGGTGASIGGTDTGNDKDEANGVITNDSIKASTNASINAASTSQLGFIMNQPTAANYSFKGDILPRFKKFFKNMKKDWNGIDCYNEMIQANYKNKFQPEWAGFYFEFLMEKFIGSNSLDEHIRFAQDKSEDGIDLDLYFPMLGAYGDLKAHSESSRAIQGNDWETVMKQINGQGSKNHIYYVVIEHTTEKDIDHNSVTAQYWNKQQHKEKLDSYAKKMKYSVNISKLYILDINQNNKQYLTKFKQGINSNKKPREPKIMIEHDNLSHFVIAEF